MNLNIFDVFQYTEVTVLLMIIQSTGSLECLSLEAMNVTLNAKRDCVRWILCWEDYPVLSKWLQ